MCPGKAYGIIIQSYEDNTEEWGVGVGVTLQAYQTEITRHRIKISMFDTTK